MGHVENLPAPGVYFKKCAAAMAVIFLLSPICAAQASKTAEASDLQWLQELRKNPELLNEFGRLLTRLQQEIELPPARSESKLLPLLPEATVAYAAYPNIGGAAHQALDIFRQELKESSALREWWHHGELATAGPKVEDLIEKFYQLSEYLGAEIAASGAMETKDPKLLIVAAVRKPGLKNFLQQILNEWADKSKPRVRVLDPQELATAEERRSSKELLVLVRPDFVVGALDLATLRSFSARLDRGGREFAATEFGQRAAQAYTGGVTSVAALDLQKLLTLVPRGSQKDQETFQRSGFADMKYLVWEHKRLAGQGLGQGMSQGELSFLGPRHGIASWLAAPAPLGSLDFASPQAMVVAALQLKKPAQVLDDVLEIASMSNANASAGLAQMEQMLGINLKEDLLNLLGGEITAELDDITPPNLVWKATLRVSEPKHLQQTISTLLAAGHLVPVQSEEGGVTYYTLRIPSAKSVEISYAFADGYLIAGSGRETVAKAIQLHKNGESLAKSKKFQAAVPPGNPSGASALIYEDQVLILMRGLQLAVPDAAEPFAKLLADYPPVASFAYGEESAIRGASTKPGMNISLALVVAAVAIPNLLRSRIAANEATAVGSVRTVNTAQITYESTYPEKGFARDLATLGPDPDDRASYSAKHAGYLDSTLANASCTAGTWCEKSGFRFTVAAVCKKGPCTDYVVVATPSRATRA